MYVVPILVTMVTCKSIWSLKIVNTNIRHCHHLHLFATPAQRSLFFYESQRLPSLPEFAYPKLFI